MTSAKDYEMDNMNDLSGVAQEWLRRIAFRRLVAIVPTETAAALTARGFAETFEDGSLAASSAGRLHLDRSGISLVPR
jgi:hypothetical protein